MYGIRRGGGRRDDDGSAHDDAQRYRDDVRGRGTTTDEDGTETTVDEEPATTADGDGETATDEDAETTTEGETLDVTFSTLYLMPNNYRFEAEYSDPDGDASGTMRGRYHGSGYYQRIEPDSTDDVFETYHVDGDDYVVLNETQCFVNPGPGATPDNDADGDAEEYGSKPDANLRPSGTTTIDGETVYVFEVISGVVEETWAIYVTASTGYLRRAETDNSTIDFYAWGDVDPIEKSEMC